jgi:hypothetical protein
MRFSTSHLTNAAKGYVAYNNRDKVEANGRESVVDEDPSILI